MKPEAHRADEVAGDTPEKARRGLSGPKVVGGVIAILALLMVGAIIAPTVAMRDRPPDIEVYGAVPDFSLVDHTGATVVKDDLVGKVMVMNFIFTRCAAVCPVFSMRMRRVQDRTGDIAADLKLLSFSVDPEYDTPEVLAAYADNHGADPSRWRFVTGNYDHVRNVVAEGFMVAMDVVGEQPMGGPDIAHSEHFVLVDRRGRIRGYYDSRDAKRVERMLRDARRVMREL